VTDQDVHALIFLGLFWAGVKAALTVLIWKGKKNGKGKGTRGEVR